MMRTTTLSDDPPRYEDVVDPKNSYLVSVVSTSDARPSDSPRENCKTAMNASTLTASEDDLGSCCEFIFMFLACFMLNICGLVYLLYSSRPKTKALEYGCVCGFACLGTTALNVFTYYIPTSPSFFFPIFIADAFCVFLMFYCIFTFVYEKIVQFCGGRS